MNRFLAKCIAAAMAISASPSFAQANGDKILDSLYERGQREMAPNWRGLGKTRESAVFVHQEIRKADNGMLSVWTHHELPSPGYIDKEKHYLSTRDRMLVDCKGARTGTTDVAYYSERFGFGAVVGTSRSKAELADVVPDSIEELLLKVVCAPKPAKAPQKAKSTTPPAKE
ncbi:surface-adhesin E family protein [Noviherbaspirillum sp. ST9]|uniref:surface-adhesin E family protein n=1 Tax=Noviherbaspirillum sp. ST9 TaxID=3401606 RepID=UPI003B587EB6